MVSCGTEESPVEAAMVQHSWRKEAMNSLSGVLCLSVLYVIGLIGCIIAGATAPSIFIDSDKVFSASSGTSRATSSYVFDITNYQVWLRLISRQAKGKINSLSDAQQQEGVGKVDISVDRSPWTRIRSAHNVLCMSCTSRSAISAVDRTQHSYL